MQDNSVKQLISLCNKFSSELDTSSLDVHLATTEGLTPKEIKKVLLYNIKYLNDISKKIQEQVNMLE